MGRRHQGALHVGTSGYQYRHWKGDFYPRKLPIREWLAYYADRFATVEINNTFYNLPDPGTFDEWREQAPAGFRFALKFSRYGTHMKHLKDPRGHVRRFVRRARRLRSRLGPILVQLPPQWGADPDRLDTFLGAVPARLRVAVELRDRSWLCTPVYDVLRRHRAALVIHDAIEKHPKRLTTSWTYLRFHGRHYRGGYSPQQLSGTASRIARWLRGGHDVYAYFNNDVGGHAPRNAADLRRFVERRVG